MSNRWLVMTALSISVCFGQTPKPYSGPRMPDGHPDLQGTYDLATLTPLDRPASAKSAVLTPEEAAKLEHEAAATRERGDQSIKADHTAPPKGGDGSVGAAGNVGDYNTGWLDPGSSYTVVKRRKARGAYRRSAERPCAAVHPSSPAAHGRPPQPSYLGCG